MKKFCLLSLSVIVSALLTTALVVTIEEEAFAECTQGCSGDTKICCGSDTFCFGGYCHFNSCGTTGKVWNCPITRGSTIGKVNIDFFPVTCYTATPCIDSPVASARCVLATVCGAEPFQTCHVCTTGASFPVPASTCIGLGCPP